jgi:hypothetical protein
MNEHQIGPFPTFLIIGAQKGATRWLRHNLGEHPDIHTVSEEVMFFNRYYERGSDWYRTAFFRHTDEGHVGEATPGYMIWREHPHITAARIEALEKRAECPNHGLTRRRIAADVIHCVLPSCPAASAFSPTRRPV